MKRFEVRKRADGYWHVGVVGENLTVYWETHAEAMEYLKHRMRCDREDRVPGEGAREEEFYATIRHFLGSMIGLRIVDITQHDEDDYRENGQGFVMLLLDDGRWLKFVDPRRIQYNHLGQDRAIALDYREGGDGLPEAE